MCLVGPDWHCDHVVGEESWLLCFSLFCYISDISCLIFLLLSLVGSILSITKTYLYIVKPPKPHFYIVKLGFIGVCIIFLISAQKQIVGTRKNRLANLCFEQKIWKKKKKKKKKKISESLSENFQFFGGVIVNIFE